MNRTRLNLMGLALLVLSGMQAMPAQAESTWLRVDVYCGPGLRLQRASGVPDGTVHTYAFGGECTLSSDYDTGPWTEGHPPLSATARWDKATGTYTETLHLLAPRKFTVYQDRWDRGVDEPIIYHVGTGLEKAKFKCDADPVINRGSHCTLITQHNGTGWGGAYEYFDFTGLVVQRQGSQRGDGFAWKATQNQPLLIGRATAKQAASLSRSHTAQINCRGLNLTGASGVPNGEKRSYTFSGTCLLYHTKSGSHGLQVTRVMVWSDWNSTYKRAREGVRVFTTGTGAGIKGSSWWNTTYTCNEDPWLNGSAQCSRTVRRGRDAPVYDPITDLMDRHPIALGMANNALKVAKLSQLERPLSRKGMGKGMVFSGLSHTSLPKSSGHKGVVLSRSSRMPSLLNSLLKPPIVRAPKQNRIFVNQAVLLEVSPALKHANYGQWEYVFGWKRADYHTAANNVYWKQTHSGNFPPVAGLASSLQPWLSPARPRAIAENSGTTGGFQAADSTLPTMGAHLNFSTLRSKRKDASYLYQFRVREHKRNSNAYGPWSPWRGFIVQERTGSPPLRQIGHKGMVFSGLSHISLPKSSGHKGTGRSRPFHLSSLLKPKLTIQYAIASSTNACDANRLLRMNVIIRNEGGPLSAHTRFAYVHAVESGGAHLTSPKVSLPAIPARKTWRGVLVIGAGKSFFPKLPGRHTLLVSIGPGHAAPGTLAYIPPPPFRATVNFPAGYCQQPHYHGIGVLMRGATRGAVHGTTRGKLTASPRHAAQQRGVQKKLTPVAPMHRLNLPMQLRLNR